MHVALVLDKALSFRGKGYSLDRIFPGAATCTIHDQRPLYKSGMLVSKTQPHFSSLLLYTPLYDVILSTVALHIIIQQISILRTLSFSTDVYQRKQEQSSSVFLQEPQKKERHTLTSIIIVSVKIVITCTMSLYECDIIYF